MRKFMWLAGLVGLFGVIAVGREAAHSLKVPPRIAVVDTPEAIPWEHGWKTKRIIATRYQNEVVGYNIGFQFPLDPMDCDRLELDDFVKKHGGNTYSGGGYPGAEMYVIFEDVTDKESADRKLKRILPEFDRVVRDLR